MLREANGSSTSQAGLTMIEMLISIAITGLISVGLASGVIHLQRVSSQNNDRVLAVKEVRNAAYWIRRDAKMAQSIEPDAGSSGLPLVLTWTEWDNTDHQVTYSVANGSLKRSYSVDGGAATTLWVARSIDADPASTNADYSDGVLTFAVGTTLGPGSQVAGPADLLRVTPRPSQ